MSLRFLRVVWLVPVAFAILTLAGCSGKPTVTGTVTYKEKTLPSGTVTFYGADNKAVSAEISEDGKYTAIGVPAGSVKVTVAVPKSGGGAPQMMSVPGAAEHAAGVPAQGSAAKEVVQIPVKYASTQTTDLQYDIHRGRNTIDIELK